MSSIKNLAQSNLHTARSFRITVILKMTEKRDSVSERIYNCEGFVTLTLY